MRLLIVGSTYYSLVDRYLRQLGCEAVVISTDRHPDMQSMSLAPKSYHIPKEAGPEEIARIAVREGVAAVLSASMPEDMNLRDARAAQILRRDYNIPMLVQPEEFITLCMDKQSTRDLLSSKGFPCVEGYRVSEKHAAIRVAERIGYPLVLKPPARWAGKGLAVVHDSKELILAVQGTSEVDMLLEPFIDGQEFSVETLAFPGGILAMPPIWKGATQLSGSHAMEKVRIGPFSCDGLQTLALDIVAELGSQGPAELEFIVDKNGPKLLEVNPRLSGVTRMSWLASGLNPLELLVDLALNRWNPDEHWTRPIVAAEIPVTVDEAIHPFWDSEVLGNPGVIAVDRHTVGMSRGRICLAGSATTLVAGIRSLETLGLCVIPDWPSLTHAMADAEDICRNGRGVVLRGHYRGGLT